ncbi:glycerol-3-phosphate dehydrogenase/oxidase [Aporhodopirellula aestuarii]|uniref:Glycerol-3-phosphate dehydrogenase n=1 Tax=Aporhodopirellula aestuarii TaxID=2950107 RepID=A0ABT0U3D7_9BACT|nr:glycerol-3-phosphate dehydrogenase/oxidase [Aporhodopirellula aestuarii]MCM2371404.1 glycerol-3-phosphate dehydrogenase/oxidase [Aporhodopirellula aestuarii]
MNRENLLRKLSGRPEPFDIVVIGGGATGVGIALDASVRGLSTLLLEQSDFGKGTSSRSTKLIHGGVRYLQQGNIALVRDSLRERARLQSNAPHLVHPLPFIVPCETWWQRFMMRTGFLIYDLLAGRSEFPRARGVNSEASQKVVSTVRSERLRWGGVIYSDGQFDDSRLLIHMAMSAADHGAELLSYCRVTGLITNEGQGVSGVEFVDQETGQSYRVAAKSVINATGPFCDAVRRMDDESAAPIIAPSQGVHIVLPREFLPGDTAVIVPKTSDGRVLFLIPWHDHVVVGTTDTPIEKATLEPTAQNAEIEFLLDTAADYLTKPPQRDDCLSVFVGVRPLVNSPAGSGGDTKSLSRDHTILISRNGLITITGGKWTTVRKMAEDCVDQAIEFAQLRANSRSTIGLKLHGASDAKDATVYGTDAVKIQKLIDASPELGARLHPALPIRAAEVVWAVRSEMARTIDDVLARRTRALFLNRGAAEESAPEVARLMAGELKKDNAWQTQQLSDFAAIARHFEMPAA